MKNILLLLSVLMLLTCSKTSNVAGTIDETGTGKPCAAVMGLVVYSDSSPVVGAAVNLYNQNSVQKIVVPLKKRLIQSINRNTQTNINGIFRIDSVDTGKYYVDINDHDSLGALVPATVRLHDTLVTVNAVLQRLGAIQGKIDTSLVSSSTKTYVYVVEAQKLVAVDSTGNFTVNSLPPYNYTLQVVHDTVVVTSPLDTAKVKVIGGDTVHVGSISPQVLVGVDTAAGVAPCTVKVIYKVTDPSGNAVTMHLNYGDGNTDTLALMSGSRSHVFIDSGSFKILLIAQDGNGGIGRDSIIVAVRKNNPPIVQVAVDTAMGSAPFTVRVVYKITDPDGDAVSTILIYGDGSIDTLLQMSGNKSHTYTQIGIYTLSLVAKDTKGGVGKDSAMIVVKGAPPTTPSLIAPLDGASGIPISLKLIWSKIQNVVSYSLQVATDTGFTNIVNGDTSVVDTFRIENGLANNSIYYWRVRAINSYGKSTWSICRSFTTIIAAPQFPTPTSPANGATGLSLTPILTWSMVTDAVTYHIQISTTNTFASILIEDSTLTTDLKTLSGLSNNTTYYWRVQSKNAGGVSAWTSPLSFTTNIAAPQAPTLTSPIDGTTGLSLTPTISWSTVSGASSYHVQVSTVNTFATIVVEDSSLTSASKALNGLSNSTTYYWRVQSKNAGGVSAWTSPLSFTTIIAIAAPQAPTLISPVFGTTGLSLTPTLTWSTVSGAATYHVQVSISNTFTTVLIEDSTLTSASKSISGLSNSTIYYWRVQAKNTGGASAWTSPISFTTIIAAPQSPILTSPADGTTGLSLTPTLTWSTVSGAATYHVQVSTSNTFATIAIEDSILTSASKSLSGLANGVTYYWRVQSKNAGGMSVWTSPISFTTVVAAPQTPTLTSPVDGATGLSLAPTLSWSTVTGASTYHVQVSTSNTFTTIMVEDSTLTTGSKVLSGLTNGTQYYWRVKAKNAGGMSAWTSPISFTTIIAAPQAPTLTSPLDGTTGLSLSPTLTWSTVSGAATYHAQVSTINTFATIVIEDSILTSPSKVLNGLSNSTTYYWRVQSKNAGGVSAWTSPMSFTTIIAAPQAPTLTSPLDGTTGLSLSPTLIWSTVSGASTYHVQVSTVNTFATIVIEDSTLTSASKVLSGLTNGTTYYWRVQSKNAGGVSIWTSPISFTTVGLSTWTNRNFATTGLIRNVVWGNNKFVAITDYMADTVLNSSDGITWTGVVSATTNNLALTWGNNQYVAVGLPTAGVGVIETSPDGITWTARNSGTPDMINGVAWGNNKFVSVEWWPSTSPDGITWTAQSGTSGNHLDGITWGNNKFVAVGRNGMIYTSPDGVTWTNQSSPTSNNLICVIWANNEYIAMGGSGTILSSPDGAIWTNRTSGTSNNINWVAWGNNQFIAVGDNGTMLSSTDGATWTSQTSGTSNALYGITYGNNKFVAVGVSGTILTLP